MDVTSMPAQMVAPLHRGDGARNQLLELCLPSKQPLTRGYCGESHALSQQSFARIGYKAVATPAGYGASWPETRGLKRRMMALFGKYEDAETCGASFTNQRLAIL